MHRGVSNTATIFSRAPRAAGPLRAGGRDRRRPPGAGLCVAMIDVSPRSRCISRSRSCSVSAVCSSRSPVGSSASSSAGSMTSARAIATRCCSPPDSMPGLVRQPLAEADALEQRRGRAVALRRRPAARSASACRRSRARVNSGSRWWNWNTKPTCVLRNAVRSSGRHRRQIDVADPHRPAVDRIEPAEHVQQRALPDARRADDRDHLARSTEPDAQTRREHRSSSPRLDDADAGIALGRRRSVASNRSGHLLVPQRLRRIELRRLARRIDRRDEADHERGRDHGEQVVRRAA